MSLDYEEQQFEAVCYRLTSSVRNRILLRSSLMIAFPTRFNHPSSDSRVKNATTSLKRTIRAQVMLLVRDAVPRKPRSPARTRSRDEDAYAQRRLYRPACFIPRAQF